MSILLTLLAPVAVVAVPSPPAPSLTFEARILAAHNAERARVGSPPLVWSADLARDAAVWAKHLAETGEFEHADDVPGRPPQGENLWMGTLGSYTPEDMVGSWIEERQLYTAGRFPNVSRSGNWIDVGHYTQLIWSRSREVGCARVANRSDDYLVCRYSPVGNIMGQPVVLQNARRTKRAKS